MTENHELDAATIRELLSRMEARKPYTYNHPHPGPNFILSTDERDDLLAIARYALELSDKVERLEQAVASQGSVFGTDWQNWKAANKHIESQAAELERLRLRVLELETDIDTSRGYM